MFALLKLRIRGKVKGTSVTGAQSVLTEERPRHGLHIKEVIGALKLPNLLTKESFQFDPNNPPEEIFCTPKACAIKKLSKMAMI